jgi:hypothetical protein
MWQIFLKKYNTIWQICPRDFFRMRYTYFINCWIYKKICVFSASQYAPTCWRFYNFVRFFYNSHNWFPKHGYLHIWRSAINHVPYAETCNLHNVWTMHNLRTFLHDQVVVEHYIQNSIYSDMGIFESQMLDIEVPND